MRKIIVNYLKETDYLLHADMFNTKKFPTKAKVINCGLGESNLLNIAGGLASQRKTVYIYGVAGFIIHRFEQLKFSCKLFGSEYGKIIIFNAGKIGYEGQGAGHLLNDDIQIMEILNIEYFQPETKEDIYNILEYLNNKKIGLYYIQLGKDFN